MVRICLFIAFRKVPITTADNIFIFLGKIRLDIICQADDSHEISSLIFSEKKKKKRKCCLHNFEWCFKI